MYVLKGFHRVLATGVTLLLASSVVFAETKWGKVTSLSLDPATNETTVTVTLGELSKPEADGEKKAGTQDSTTARAPTGAQSPLTAPDAQKAPHHAPTLTLGSESVTFALTNDIRFEPFHPQQAKKNEAKDEKTDSENKASNQQPCPRMAQANGMSQPLGNQPPMMQMMPSPMMMQQMMMRPMMQQAPMAQPPMQQHASEKLTLGSVVQLVYADDGTTVKSIQVLPDMQRNPGMAPGHQLPPAGMMGMMGMGAPMGMMPPMPAAPQSW